MTEAAGDAFARVIVEQHEIKELIKTYCPHSNDWERSQAAQAIATMNDDFKPPAPADREDGLELLAWHRGKWVHVKWSADWQMWSQGYGGPFVEDGTRQFAPLPTKPQDNTFWDY